MAIASISIPANSWILPGSAAPQRVAIQNDIFLAFDDTTEETCYSPRFRFTGYGGGTLTATVFGCFESETTATDEAVIAVSVEALDAGDSVDMDAGTSFDSENSVEIDPVATAGYPVEGECTLANKDSVGAGDWVRLKLARLVDDAADTATDDFYISCVEIAES